MKLPDRDKMKKTYNSENPQKVAKERYFLGRVLECLAPNLDYI